MKRIGCSNQEECPLRNSRMGCREDIDHFYWPANRYAKGIAKVFRELEENKTITCRFLHEERHQTEAPPEMPSLDAMHQAVLNARLTKGGESETAA